MGDVSMDCKDLRISPEQEEQGIESTILSVQEEISELRLRQRSLDEKRREALNKLLDLKGSIRVFCRIRPNNSLDKWKKESPISTEEEKINIKSVGTKKEFIVDSVFNQASTQEEVFKEVEPIIKSAIDGHNICILSYGQTGTGKTYTMEGVRGNLGIVPRAIEELFRQISGGKSENYTLSMSMLEVYVGSVRDLLAPKQYSSKPMEIIPKSNLNILAKSNGAVEIEGLTDIEMSDLKQAKICYNKGKKARSTSWTHVNETSSRSHCLTRVIIRRSDGPKRRIVSKIWLVDLGGSERLLKTGATGQTMDEGKAINLSLSALGDVISALKRKRNHIPYRNSKLTQILSDSLGDGSKVLMVVHISPYENDLAETICSLSFAKRVRSIESNREISEETKRIRQKYMSELEKRIHETEAELCNLKNQIEKAKNLIQEKNKMEKITNGSPRSPLVTANQADFNQILQNSEKISTKPSQGSIPRFMNSTVCSRQRQTMNGETINKLKSSKIGNIKHINLSGSQSLSVSSPFFLSNSRTFKKNDSVVSEVRKVTNYNPTVRVSQHRRRMSAFM